MPQNKFLLLQAEFLVELFNTSAAVYQLLLTGEERVALGTDFHSDILLGGTCLDHISAGTSDGSRLIIGMDAVFHAVTAFHSCLSPMGSNPSVNYAVTIITRVMENVKCYFFSL